MKMEKAKRVVCVCVCVCEMCSHRVVGCWWSCWKIIWGGEWWQPTRTNRSLFSLRFLPHHFPTLSPFFSSAFCVFLLLFQRGTTRFLQFLCALLFFSMREFILYFFFWFEVFKGLHSHTHTHTQTHRQITFWRNFMSTRSLHQPPPPSVYTVRVV